MKRKVNIAIDGPSGAGKSTVANEIATRLGYTFINSGSVYRAIAYNAVQQGIETIDKEGVIASLRPDMISLDCDDKIFLDGEDISKKIRAEYISQITPNVAKIPEVRAYVVDLVQHMTKKRKGFIIDGRDTTFKLMPHAEVKIFLWADPEERARRRWNQNKILGFETDYNEVLYDVKKRDAQDMNREVDPLHKTEDSVLIDCTKMNQEEVIEAIIDLVNQKVG
ncbi:(d)CMP kinase [Mycoplasmopsis gallopavonis]|uniref:Cytidylate kinase n=1 Tax=Mycoplasmopsis gallopavonis TaxID=76629 RepID=A0A449AYU8_9BACT|nr:(d)CMP kinase [Mycoplasmopsis gallopavonis]RIV16399.1 (d)CMP kinase [Mycoplasmopsis gallopavonis]VEU72703.1 cytidylate kinase [Mycoplasmopsis gallopavonis]